MEGYKNALNLSSRSLMLTVEMLTSDSLLGYDAFTLAEFLRGGVEENRALLTTTYCRCIYLYLKSNSENLDDEDWLNILCLLGEIKSRFVNTLGKGSDAERALESLESVVSCASRLYFFNKRESIYGIAREYGLEEYVTNLDKKIFEYGMLEDIALLEAVMTVSKFLRWGSEFCCCGLDSGKSEDSNIARFARYVKFKGYKSVRFIPGFQLGIVYQDDGNVYVL